MSASVLKRPMAKRMDVCASSSLTTDGAQHVGRLQRGGAAGASGRDRDLAQAHHQRLALDVREAHVEVAGQAPLQVAVERHLVEALEELRAQAFAQGQDARALGGHFRLRDREGRAHSDDSRHVQRSRAHAALLAAAVHLRGDADARVLRADVERADAPRCRRRWSRRRPPDRCVPRRRCEGAVPRRPPLPPDARRRGPPCAPWAR